MEEKSELYNYIILAALVVTSFLLIRQCGIDQKGSVEVITKTDTIITPGKIDTIEIFRTKTVHKNLTSTITDTIYLDSIVTYTTVINDSLIEGEIYSLVSGELLDVSFTYTPKFPKYIKQTDTFKIKNETKITRNPYRFYVGSTIGGGATSFSLTPSIILKTPKKLALTLGYDLINKTYNVGAFTEISFK